MWFQSSALVKSQNSDAHVSRWTVLVIYHIHHYYTSRAFQCGKVCFVFFKGRGQRHSNSIYISDDRRTNLLGLMQKLVSSSSGFLDTIFMIQMKKSILKYTSILLHKYYYYILHKKLKYLQIILKHYLRCVHRHKQNLFQYDDSLNEHSEKSLQYRQTLYILSKSLIG